MLHAPLCQFAQFDPKKIEKKFIFEILSTWMESLEFFNFKPQILILVSRLINKATDQSSFLILVVDYHLQHLEYISGHPMTINYLTREVLGVEIGARSCGWNPSSNNNQIRLR